MQTVMRAYRALGRSWSGDGGELGRRWLQVFAEFPGPVDTDMVETSSSSSKNVRRGVTRVTWWISLAREATSQHTRAMAEIHRTDYVIDSNRCVVRASGPQTEREAVVFLHGNPGSSEDWLDLLAHAGDFGRAIAIDMPAFGKAERPRQFDYSVPGYARYLDGVLRTLGIDRVHFVLHDFGGPWGAQWAVDHPSRVTSIVFCNSGILPSYRWHRVARLWRTPLVGEVMQSFASRNAFKAVLNGGNPKPFPEAFLDRMFDDSDAVLKRAQLALYRATPNFDSLCEAIVAKIVPLDLPVLVVWGEGDPFIDKKYAQLQSQYFRAEIHTLPNAGHWPMVDEPERVREWVIPFLQKQLGRAPHQSASKAS
jgi:pimeloyl-ACP methyl ester carboxylesterase